MAYIELNNNLPGIVGLLDQYPETGKPLRELAENLLRGDSSLSAGERELIAAYVSHKNDCLFCQGSHGAAAKHLLEVDYNFIEKVNTDLESSELSDKMKALLEIAGTVQKGGKNVSEKLIQDARKQGATDEEIHHTVLIAAAFCMYNRYVDGLSTWTPKDKEAYDNQGARLAKEGYLPTK